VKLFVYHHLKENFKPLSYVSNLFSTSVAEEGDGAFQTID